MGCGVIRKMLDVAVFILYCYGGCIYCIGAVSCLCVSVYITDSEWCIDNVSCISGSVHFLKYGISRSSGSFGYSIGDVIGVAKIISLSFPFS